MSTLDQGILILDYGSQYTQLIARRIRELHVYCEIWPFHDPRVGAAVRAGAPPARGVILSGGPASVHVEGSPDLAPGLLELGMPVLGICYGMQLMGQFAGSEVRGGAVAEYGRAHVSVDRPCRLWPEGGHFDAWMSHGDSVQGAPPGFEAVAHSENGLLAAIEHTSRPWFGLQFHPEVAHTEQGAALIARFVHELAGCSASWSMGSFLERSIATWRERIGDKHVVCGLSGGVDSSVAAALLARAIGRQLTCIFVDTGLLRLGERELVEQTFGEALGVDLRVVDARERFLSQLAGVTDPETKRKRIGETFVRVFEEAASGIPGADFLAQGTLYPDVIESVSVRGPSATIKSHHNVGGLPADMKLRLVEPLRELFKDEVRALGRELGLPEALIGRHPFPGPGLAVRILGEVTEERLDALRRADDIFIRALRDAGRYSDVWQAFAVLIPVKTVGVMGDARTYEWVCALRAVTSTDGMTADRADLPISFLGKVSDEIINRVRRFNRVVYDVSSKPPATIEWE